MGIFDLFSNSFNSVTDSVGELGENVLIGFLEVVKFLIDVFDFFQFMVLAPLLAMILFVFFFAVNYYIVLGHIWLFTKGYDIGIKLIDFVTQKEVFLEKLILSRSKRKFKNNADN